MTTETPVAVPAAPARDAASPPPAADAAAAPAEDASVTGAENGFANMSIAPQPQSELHRACAEGRIDEVRGILARGLEQLEALDIATGCTPIVLAVHNGHAEVVRELLAAGAIVPPPSVTMEPSMLAILYPQPPMYAPPPFAQMPPQFFPPQGFYPFPRKESANGVPNGHAQANGSPNGHLANLPPAEVAKTIPCRNFPNCKYGGSCMFFHPRPQPGFFSPGYVPYEAGFYPPPQFYPGAQDFVPSGNSETPQSDAAPTSEPEANGHDNAAHVPSALTPAFVPGMPHGEVPNGVPFSPPQAFMSPPPMPAQLPMPSDPAFFATSPPPQFQQFIPNGYPGPRRQSFGQFPAPKPYAHGKKPSFSGGPKPWGPGRPGGSHLGQWKDGNPPPCAFFREGKCRNGEFCKFPHMDAEGNDCRHPDVIRGLIPPMPTRPPRVMRMMQNYDPAVRHQQILQAKAAAAAANAVAEGEGEESASASDKETASLSASATLPPKPSGSLPPSRSGSQPGVSRVQNGAHSRSHSPSRRGPRPYVNGHASRSSSNGAAEAKKSAPPQRIPRADEFPALGPGATERREPSWGKTAAQVLSEPAPVKEEEAGEEKEEEKGEEEAELQKSPVVTMDSDSEQDAVIVSVSTTPNPEVAKAKLQASSSFASVAGVLDPAPVALKA